MKPSDLVAALGADTCRFDIDLLEVCDSTNAVLLARAEAGAPAGSVVVAATQTAGRGRRGRAWLSTPGDSLTFSLLWRFPAGTSLSGLSLAVGLAVAQALGKVGADGTAPLRLKWPNDLLQDDRKLGGILIELVPGAPQAAVIGIGLNLRLPPAMPEEVRAQAAALGSSIDPALLLAAILSELLAACARFAAEGFVGMRAGWITLHAHQDKPVTLHADFAPPREGICRGVDEDGALLFESAGRIERILSGEVSLRGVS